MIKRVDFFAQRRLHLLDIAIQLGGQLLKDLPRLPRRRIIGAINRSKERVEFLVQAAGVQLRLADASIDQQGQKLIHMRDNRRSRRQHRLIIATRCPALHLSF